MDPSLYHRFFEVEDRHWWFVGRRAVVGALLGQALGKADVASSSRRILDVGCGTGGMLPLLSRFGRVTGVDSEPLALDYCRRRGFNDVHLQESFSAETPFDVITLFDVLEHVPDDVDFLAWLRGLMNPDGRLVLTVPAFPFLWSRHDELNHHQRRYRRPDLKATLEKGGFRVERLTYFNFWLFPAAVATRAGGRRGGASPDTATGSDHAADAARRHESAADAEEILKPLRIGAANPLLTSILASEAALVRGMDLPWGVSLAAVARPIS